MASTRPEGASTAVGVDVGGTKIRAARVAADGELIEHVVEPVERERTRFADQLVRLITKVSDHRTVGIGIGIPGRVEAQAGTILSAGYLDIAGLDLSDLVRESHGLPARIENDAMMALIAEVHARPAMSGGLILMVTVGTGIGGAIVVDGKPWHGGGVAGQFGHLVVASEAADGPVCNCGRRGCIETLSSGTVLRRLMDDADMPAELSAAALIARAQSGDIIAQDILNRWTKPFHRALQSLVSAFDPRLIVIGGGLGGDMVDALARIDKDNTWFDVPIEAAKFGDDAGVIGSGLLGFVPITG